MASLLLLLSTLLLTAGDPRIESFAAFDGVATMHAREAVRTAFDRAPDAASVMLPQVLDAPPLRLEFVASALSPREACWIGSGDATSATQEPPLVCYRIAGRSMLPEFADGERVVVASVPPDALLRHGDVVIATIGEHYVIKRIVAMPGETLELRGGMVLRDGLEMPEPAANRREAPDRAREWRDGALEGRDGARVVRAGTDDAGPLRLGEDEYFLLGDNRALSVDSRHYGPLRRSSIAGKVLCHVKEIRADEVPAPPAPPSADCRSPKHDEPATKDEREARGNVPRPPAR